MTTPLGRFLAAFLLLGLFSPQAHAQGRTVSSPGLFSYQIPKGWQTRSAPVSRYDVALAPPTHNFAANINVVAQDYPKTLAEYIAANKAFLKSSPMFLNVRYVDEKPFVTSSGLQGVRLVVDDTLSKLDLQQVFYFFDGPGQTKLVVTATSSVLDGDQYAPIFDTSLKTFTSP